MAHIPEGVVSTPLLIGGGVAAIALTGYALRQLQHWQIPRTATLAGVFFIASLIAFPLGPTSAHLLLNGLLGLLLGWAMLPAIVVALVLQLAFFGYGGPLILGLNSLNIALPGLVCALLLRPALQNYLQAPEQFSNKRPMLLGASAGAIGVIGTSALVAASLWVSGRATEQVASLLFSVQLPLAVIEAAVCASLLSFVCKVAPQLIEEPK